MYKPQLRRYNRYQDVEINAELLPHDELGKFLIALSKEESYWMDRLASKVSDSQIRSNSLFWVKIPVKLSHLLPSLLAMGAFNVHHADSTYIMLVKGPDGTKNMSVPLYGTHYSRVECLVMDPSNSTVLIVNELVGTSERRKKLVTGSVDSGEHPSSAAMREVMEETGLLVRFVGLIGVVSRLGTRFGRDEILIGCLLYLDPPGQVPRPSSSEIKKVEWVPLEDVLTGKYGKMTGEWANACKAMYTCPGPFGETDLEDFRGTPHMMRMYSNREIASIFKKNSSPLGISQPAPPPTNVQ
jgi:8-oxo-dGTP pyrophosphatase MutT (NUDIX family)